MAKTFVRISLATKFRLLFAAAVLVIIAAALLLPWYVTERMLDEAAEGSGRQLTRLGLVEWTETHPLEPRPAPEVARYFTAAGGGRRGPVFLHLSARPPDAAEAAEAGPGLLPPDALLAAKVFREDPQRNLVLLNRRDDDGRRIYRALRAVRATADCRRCHDGRFAPAFQPGQLVGLIDASLPPKPEGMIWWTRGVFTVGGLLAALLALAILYAIVRRIILMPLRRLTVLADSVAEGDMSVRSDLAGGDEFEALGTRYNEMLDAIQRQQDQLRKANRALDLRLSELAESNVALYEANRIKNEFLANVSHELRTPLNSIIGFAELMVETEDEKRRRHATNILTSARMLLGIINDLLDLARIEAGKAEVRLEKVSIRDICETLGQLTRPMADKKGLAMTVDLADDLPVLQTDPGKVQQVLYNLLSNAIKFTPPGGSVTMTARRLAGGESSLGKGAVAVAVADTGPGIPAAEQQVIFEKFRRLDDTITRSHGGAGLGLAISRELTNLIGGRLTLTSEPGHGATFTMTLPVTPPERLA